MESKNLQHVNNFNEPFKKENLEKSFQGVVNALEYSKINTELKYVKNLTINPLLNNLTHSYFELKLITVRLDYINNKIRKLKASIQYLENNIKNIKYINGNSMNLDLHKLKSQESFLIKNREKIGDNIEQKQKEYALIRNDVKLIRENIKEEKLKINYGLKETIFTESSRMFTIELELSHLEREKTNYNKRIEEIQKKISLMCTTRNRLNIENLKLKNKFVMFQQKLRQKEQILENLRLLRINLEDKYNLLGTH